MLCIPYKPVDVGQKNKETEDEAVRTLQTTTYSVDLKHIHTMACVNQVERELHV
jgi:hypothetical protein